MTTKLDIVDENTPPSIAAGSIANFLPVVNIMIHDTNYGEDR